MPNDFMSVDAPALDGFDPAAAQFSVYLDVSGCSPNTARAYAQDLSHLRSFLVEQDLEWPSLTPALAVDLLLHLRSKRSHRRGAASIPRSRQSTASGAHVSAPRRSTGCWPPCRHSTSGAGSPSGSMAPTRSHGFTIAPPLGSRNVMDVPDRRCAAAAPPIRSPVRLRQIHRVPARCRMRTSTR